jgi:hypothetical protein
MAQITSQNVAVAITKLVAARALPVLESNLFMGRLVNRDYEATLAQVGASVDIPIAPSMSVNNIAETGTVTTQNPNLGNATITLTTHLEATFQIPDVTKALANLDLVDVYMQPAMLAVAERVEADLLGVYPMFTFNPVLGASNTAPTEDVIDSVENTFFKAKINPTVTKYLACSADFYAAVRQIPRFSEVQKIGSGNAIITGEFGMLKNINFFRSQIVQPISSTTNNFAFTRDAIALVTRKLDTPLPGTGAVAAYVDYGNIGMRVVMSYNPQALGMQFTVDILYGVGQLRPQAGILVNS